MQLLEVSAAVRPIYGSLGVKGLTETLQNTSEINRNYVDKQNYTSRNVITFTNFPHGKQCCASFIQLVFLFYLAGCTTFPQLPAPI